LEVSASRVANAEGQPTNKREGQLDRGCFCVNMVTMLAMLILSGFSQLKEWL
jgi:hypothetical protein